MEKSSLSFTESGFFDEGHLQDVSQFQEGTFAGKQLKRLRDTKLHRTLDRPSVHLK